jgi:hypothetical protein
LSHNDTLLRRHGVDLIKADVEGAAALSLLCGDAPTEIYVDELDMPLATAFLKLGKDNAHQVVALRMHVTERAADKDSNCAPGLWHG